MAVDETPLKVTTSKLKKTDACYKTAEKRKFGKSKDTTRWRWRRA